MEIRKALREFAIDDKRARWKIYRVIIGLGFAYGVLNGVVLNRPTRQVTFELAVFMAIVTVAAFIWSLWGVRRESHSQTGINRSSALILILVASASIGLSAAGRPRWE